MAESVFPHIADVFAPGAGTSTAGIDFPSIEISLGNMNPFLAKDQAGFFGSMFSAATKEQIGMEPSAEVQQYRNENPIRGFTSQVIPEIALFSIPATKIGAIAVKGFKPAMALIKYGETATKAGRTSIGAASKLTGEILPILAARQALSVVAPEEDTFSNTLVRNATDVIFGGAFAGTAEFLKGARQARRFELRPGMKEPEHSIALVQQYHPKYTDGTRAVDLNNPPQDQYATMLRLANEHPDSPVFPDIVRAGELMRAEVLTETPIKRPFVRALGTRAANAFANGLFRAGKLLTEVGDEFGIKSILPKDFEAFTKHPRAVEVIGQADKAKVWTELNDNMLRMDKNTWMRQEGSEGLFTVVKQVHSEQAGRNQLFSGLNLPDRYLVLKTSKPNAFIDMTTTSAKSLDEYIAFDPRYKKVADTGFLESRAPKGPRSRTIELEPDVEASVLPGNTPTLYALDREINLAKPWQKGIYGVAEATDRLETPALVKNVLGRLSDSAPVTVPLLGDMGLPGVVKSFSYEAGNFIREAARVSKKIFAPTISQFTLNPRASVINQITQQAFHRMLGKSRQMLWGSIPDEAIKGNLMKNLFLKRHDPRVGGILGKAVQVLNTDERLAEFAKAWRGNWSPEEAAQNGLGSEIVGFLKDLKAYDYAQIVELKATRAALGIEDDFVPLENHYALARMWEGNFRVELYDDLTGEVVGYAGGHRPADAMEKAREIVGIVNAQGAGKLRAPISDHISTTAYLRYSTELAGDATRVAKEVDAFQRGGKLNANNLLVRQVISASQKLMMEAPQRFKERAGLLGFRGQYKPLTLDEVIETISANTMETQRLLTKEALVSRLAPEIAKLAGESPDMYRQFATRFNSHLGYQGPMAKHLDNMVDTVLVHVMGPHGASKVSRKMNRGMFGLTLGGGDLGFLAVNQLTGIQTIIPEASRLMTLPPERLMPWYGLEMLNTKRGPALSSFIDPARVTWQGVKELVKLTDESDPALFAAVMRAREEGVISKPIISEIREFGELAASQMKAGNPVEAVMRFNEDIIGRTEEFSRAWAFVTGRKVAMDFLGQSEEQAFETARKFVSRTMYEYSAGERGRITTGAIGGGWGLFKNWTMHYVSNMMGYANEAVYHNNWQPLLWGMIGTGSVGGAVAMPGYGMASAFSKWASDKDLTEWTYEAADYGGKAGTFIADGFNYGFPSVFGVTLQGRASAPGSSLIRDTSMFINLAMLDRAQGMYNFFGNAIDQMQEGNLSVLSDERVRRSFVQAVMPRTLQRAYTHWGIEGLDSLKTGNRLVDKLSGKDAFLYAVGLTPVEIERTFDTAAVLFEDTKKLRERIQFYGESYAIAHQNFDFDEKKRIYARAAVEGLPFGSIHRSAASRMQKDNGDLLERQFDEKVIWAAKRARGFE